MSVSARYDLVLVGGGIIGACLAEELAAGGASVLVLDADGSPGHATSAAAGVAVPSLRYAADPSFFTWLQDARRALATDITRLQPLHGQFSLTAPIVRLLEEEELAATPSLRDAVGVPVTLPQLAQDDSRTPYQCSDGLMVDGRKYLRAVHAAALAAGAVWRQGVRVNDLADEATGVRVSDLDATIAMADRVVVTAGAWTGALTGLPITPQRGQLATLACTEALPFILSGRHYLAPLPEGGIVAGSTEENAGFAAAPTAVGIARVLTRAIRAMPALADAVVTGIRAGLRPVSGTGRPIIGRIPGTKRIYACAGHAGHGLLTARQSAAGLAAGLLYKDWEALPTQFCPDRGRHGCG